MASLWAVSTGRVDRVLWAPCHRHPFGKGLAPFDDRMDMCRLAVANLVGVEVSAIDRDSGAEGRTLLVLRGLAAERPSDEIFVLLGADLLADRARWYGYEEIDRMAKFLVVGRAGFTSPGGAPDLPPLSSSAIRGAIGRGEDVSAWLPAAVLDYIRQHGLYGAR